MTTPHSETLGSEAVQRFKTAGYYLHRGLFPAETALSAASWLHGQDQETLAKSWTEQEPAVPLAVCSVVHQETGPIAAMVLDPRILALASELIGDETYVWASKVNVKAKWCGTAEYYHQDLVYWKDRGYPKDEMLSCMVFLEPHNLENAALHVLPGTHRRGFIPHEPFININGLAKYMVPPATLDRLVAAHGIESINAEPGDALFFHTSLVHGSSHNISPNGRMILLAQLNTVGNEPTAVTENARLFNLRRAEFEMAEAERRYAWFKDKYEKQLASSDLTFAAPIPKEEQK